MGLIFMIKIFIQGICNVVTIISYTYDMIASDLTKGLNFPKKGTGTFSQTMKLFRYQYLLYKIHNYFFSYQLKIYFDISALQLLVTVVSASGLTPRADGSPRCPYAKIFLLPDKSEKSKRRTKTFANTLEPRWNQTFVYCGIRITDIKKRTLEVIFFSNRIYIYILQVLLIVHN